MVGGVRSLCRGGSSSGIGIGIGVGVGVGCSNTIPLLHPQTVPSSSQPLDAFFISGSSPSVMGSSSMVSFGDVCGGKRWDRSFFSTYEQDENGDDDLDDYFHQPEKKRRLTSEQVQFLEKSFEAENKLEPERKIQLAKDLGLQPRQVAIWFQNRRARWKTKQLEKDFDTLQANFDSLKADYEILLNEKEKLKDEVLHLTEKLHLKEKEQGLLEPMPSKVQCQLETAQLELIVDSAAAASEGDADATQDSVLVIRQLEELSSAKSDVFDSDSPCCVVDGGNSFFAEPGGDSSYAFEPDQSDLSQDEEDNLCNGLFPSCYVFPELLPAYFGVQAEDQATWFWSF
ncbi:hypothetical protein Dimus_004850 [Dionaea muscipula]